MPFAMKDAMRNMTSADLPTLQFSFHSHVFDTRQRGEFGELIEGLAYAVYAEAPSGLRWVSASFATEVLFSEEDGIPFSSGARLAQAKAYLLVRAARRDRTLALDFVPTNAVYGSAAYGRDEEWSAMDEEEQDGHRRQGTGL